MSLNQSSVAIYRQIIEYFEYEIASGRLQAGDRIESIRTLAVNFKVNPNTIQKALNELERMNIIETDRTNGKFITGDVEMIETLRHTVGNRLGIEFIKRCKTMGLTFEETMDLVTAVWREENE